MRAAARAQIDGACTGYNGGAVFRLTNGQVWQQSRYLYRYQYAYRPEVRLYEEAGKQMLQIAGMEEAVEVTRAQIVCQGTIVSKFKGFRNEALFEFQNGQVWRPAEYKYNYHYAYRPNATVVNGIKATTLHVEGMSETLTVRRER